MRRSLAARRAERPLLAAIQQTQPRLVTAVLADARLASRQRGDTRVRSSRLALVAQVLHLVWATDAFGALLLYRLGASCQRRGIPAVGHIAHRLAVMWAQVSIGDRTVIAPGVLLPHGQVVIDGIVRIEAGVRIRPFVTIGLVDGDITGPTIQRGAKIGTGAKLLGPVTIGERANIGANAVVLADVAPGTAVGGVPARPLAISGELGHFPDDVPENPLRGGAGTSHGPERWATTTVPSEEQGNAKLAEQMMASEQGRQRLTDRLNALAQTEEGRAELARRMDRSTGPPTTNR